MKQQKNREGYLSKDNSLTGEKLLGSEPIPQLSHLQFAVLEVLGTVEMSGKDLRSGLSELGIKKSGPAFYQMMARMEESKFVKGWYNQLVIDGQIVRERHYKITSNGVDELNTVRKFYERRIMGEVTVIPSFA